MKNSVKKEKNRSQSLVNLGPFYCTAGIRLSEMSGNWMPTVVRWGSEIWAFEIQQHFKSQLFEHGISNGWALAIAIALVPTIQKLKHLNSGHFGLNFKWFLTKWRPFIRISNIWASRFQIPFEIQTIYSPTSFCRFEIQTSPDFRSPL